MVTLDEVRETAKNVALQQRARVYVIFDKKTLEYDYRTVISGNVMYIGEYDPDGYWIRY